MQTVFGDCKLLDGKADESHCTEDRQGTNRKRKKDAVF